MPMQTIADQIAETREETNLEEVVEPTSEIETETPPSEMDILRDIPPEALPYVQAARVQEKKKLYEEKSKLAQDLKDARANLSRIQKENEQLRKPQTTPMTKPQTPTEHTNTENNTSNPNDERFSRLESLVESLANTLQQRELREAETAKKTALSTFRQSLIDEARASGVGVIASLIGGDSEEEIEASFEIAKAEYALAIQDHEKNNPAPQPQQRTLRGTPRVAVRPTGVPNVRSAGSNNSDTLSRERIKELTSMEAIRDGSYAENRKQLLGLVKRIAQ